MSERNATVGNTEVVVPSIEVTEFQENAAASEPAQVSNHINSGGMIIRSSRYQWKKSLTLIFRRGLLTFVPHIALGAVMIIIGYVSWEIRYERTSLIVTNVNLSFLNGYRNENPMIRTDIFSISCVGVGGELILTGVSGLLMVRQKLQEYVHCHTLWMSISALCSLVFIVSCSFGLRGASEITQAFAATVYVAIAVTSLEIVLVLSDLYWLTYHKSKYFGQDLTTTRNSVVTAGRRARADPAIQRGGVSTRRSPSERQNGPRSSPSLGIRNTHRRPITSQGYHGRRRRSGQAIARDRMHLQPGFNPSAGRNRLRRRPMLRAQNHYISLPTAYGRPRALSRTRNQNSNIPSRQITREVPMFVIANHSRYVQELNQSMENLESNANRGSVPGDAFPLINASEAEKVTKSTLQKSKSLDVACSLSSNSNVTPAFLADLKPAYQTDHGRLEPRQGQSREKKVAESVVNESLPNRRKARDNFGYSMVMKTKQSDCGPKRVLKNTRSVGDEIPQNRRRQDIRNFSVSGIEGSIFHCPDDKDIHRFTCFRSEKSSQDIGKTGITKSRLRFVHTASEGDFKNILHCDNSSHKKNFLTSVSSDSGIGDGVANVNVKIESQTRYRHKQSPRRPHVEDPIEMEDIATHEFPLSPVSNTTPSYENVTNAATDDTSKFQY